MLVERDVHGRTRVRMVVAPFLPIHAPTTESALFQGGPAGWAEVRRFLFR